MGSEELREWMAFFSLEDKDYKEKLELKVAEEDQPQMTNEELAAKMRDMLLGLKNG